MAEAMLSADSEHSVGRVEKRYFAFGDQDEPLHLDNRPTLPEVTTCYEVYGQLNRAADNVVLVEHGLTGSSHAAGRYSLDNPYAGYWEPLIGPGKALDTDKLCVIAVNALGGCRGTTGPSSINPHTGEPYGLSFPIITVRDMVRVQKVLMDHLGVRRIRLALGGSMGGVQALEWAVNYPHMIDRICPIAAAPRTSAPATPFN